jgi:hypothetical protein
MNPNARGEHERKKRSPVWKLDEVVGAPQMPTCLGYMVSAAGLEPATHALKGARALKTQHLQELLGGHSGLL